MTVGEKKTEQVQFRVVDDGITRSDLASRKEVKYDLSGCDVGKLRSILAANCQRLIHNEQVSVVRSIYFDDHRLSACRANLDGLARRRKLRVRWYDSPLPNHDFFLEVKWRDNRVTGKHRIQLNSPVPLHELSFREISSALLQVAPSRFVPDLWVYSDPIILVQYNREHFASRDGSTRVTLDYGLHFYAQSAHRCMTNRFARLIDDFVVLEGKGPFGCDARLRRLLYPIAPRATRCSKYVHGCQELGLVSGLD